jgi:hypothetical protein
LEKSSPAGTAGKKRRFQPSLRDWMAILSDPGVETPGYFQNVPAGHSFRLSKIEVRSANRQSGIQITRCPRWF